MKKVLKQFHGENPANSDDYDGKIVNQKVPMRNAMNEITRQAYVDDCNIGIKRWNRLIKKYGYEEYCLKLPSIKFRRNIGIWANLPFNTSGSILPVDTYNLSLIHI